jgi:hypothetical protein
LASRKKPLHHYGGLIQASSTILDATAPLWQPESGQRHHSEKPLHHYGNLNQASGTILKSHCTTMAA